MILYDASQGAIRMTYGTPAMTFMGKVPFSAENSPPSTQSYSASPRPMQPASVRYSSMVYVFSVAVGIAAKK